MRIGVWHNLPSGGGKRALHDQVRGLIGRGHHVEIWSPSTADHEYLPLSELALEHVLPLNVEPPPEWLDRISHALALRHLFKSRLTAIDEHCRRCANEINSGGFDVALVAPCRYFRTSPLPLHLSIPAVLYLHEPFRRLYEALPRPPWMAMERPANLVKRFTRVNRLFSDFVQTSTARWQVLEEVTHARAFNTILANSYFSRESILRAYGLESNVCRLGIDTTRFRSTAVEKEDFVVGIGSITREKRVDFVVEAVGRIPLPRPKLVWIGNASDPSYLHELQQLAMRVGVELDLKVMVPDIELVDLVSKATVMAYAPRLEPLGYAPLEANACGTAVVAVAEGGVRETVIDGVNGLLVDSDHDAMATAIQTLRGPSELARRLGAQGAAMVAERWSMSEAISELERHLSTAAARKAITGTR